MRVLFAMTLNVVGVTAIVASMWPVAASVYIVQPARILWLADGYRPASFIVEEIEYYGRRRGQPAVRAQANGTVEGAKESIEPHLFLKPIPRNEFELRQRLPLGAAIPVLYNPDSSEDTIGGESARLLPLEDDFQGRAWRRLRQGLRTAYLPALILVPLTAATTRLFRRWLGNPAEDQPRNLMEALLSPGIGDRFLAMAGVSLVVAVLIQVLLFLVT